MPATLPSRYFIFVNQMRTIAVHNARNGGFTSASYGECGDATFAGKYLAGTVDYLPFTVNETWHRGTISPFLMSSISNYTCEYHAELTRRTEFPTLPSRLSATYAFGDYETCETVANRHKWDLGSVMEFELRMVDDDPFVRVARVNMEVVSLVRAAFLNSSLDEETTKQIWRHYWSGSGSLQMELPGPNFERQVHDFGEIWEYLIEGRLDIAP